MEPNNSTHSVEVNGTVIAERRAVSRHRVFKGATLSFNGGYAAMECVVRNMSDAGALLRFGDATGVPAKFDLHIFGETQTRPANVRWRSGQNVGVSFYAAGLPPVA